jgi:uncharacterized protein YbaR (Trm112 family)
MHMENEFPDFLTCPITHSPLRREGQYLVAEKWGVKYPIRDGLPVLLASAALLPPGIGSIEELQEAMQSSPSIHQPLPRA